ncbi:hypothetical protein [Aphanothece sacrum]|uniref:Uncharacterized protein n=1 Tax=Aphanothece sacrum FPU1 TaxID=1920663 RepID=A0A401IGU5_APHSA|nr:hypothetical protein [Aphanothece sacrum]GBF80444.1 hypothetical protein AsFPU1_1845 [Aphanothece sacrum FPU1]GBF85525.1 hypothetical protein AsFPU3_2587 [Aphanothece sacrum FPU3]
MTSEADKQRDRQIYQEILAGRKFSLAEAIGQEAGDFLKGESPVPKLLQAITEINNFIANNLEDSLGALQGVLQTWVTTDEAAVSSHLDKPLLALQDILESVINNDQLLYELVRQVDFKWGQIYDEKPYFQQPGSQPHVDDEYTHESVRSQLMALLNKLNL